jgi:hypothetical protein
MWESGKISVATEHFASAIVEALLNTLYSRIISNLKLIKRWLLGVSGRNIIKLELRWYRMFLRCMVGMLSFCVLIRQPMS